MSIPLLLRNFKERDVRASSSDKNPVSMYFPVEMEESLRKLSNKIPESNYILCPVYSEGDFQIGVTGKLKQDESTKQGMRRELYEETGVIPTKDEDLENLRTFNTEFRNFFIFSLNVKNVAFLNEEKENKSLDDRKNRVGCFVFGSKKDMVSFISSDYLYNFPANDDIVGVAAVNLKDILQYIK